jgi:hypothetical protein
MISLGCEYEINSPGLAPLISDRASGENSKGEGNPVSQGHEVANQSLM